MSTKVAKRALELADNIIERARREHGIPIGMQEAGVRRVRGVIRRARDGDMRALAEVYDLASENGHVQGEQLECPVCREVIHVLGEEA